MDSYIKMTFRTSENTDLIVTIPNAKENVSTAAVQESASLIKIADVIDTEYGSIQSLKDAVLYKVTTKDFAVN